MRELDGVLELFTSVENPKNLSVKSHELKLFHQRMALHYYITGSSFQRREQYKDSFSIQLKGVVNRFSGPSLGEAVDITGLYFT
jgi:hypothetical protein